MDARGTCWRTVLLGDSTMTTSIKQDLARIEQIKDDISSIEQEMELENPLPSLEKEKAQLLKEKSEIEAWFNSHAPEMLRWKKIPSLLKWFKTNHPYWV
jgi:hypothetical protein